MDVVDRAAVAPDYRPQLVPAEFARNGPFARLDAWLAANMGTFGFFRPYTTDRGGVQPEPWHLSFAPVAEAALAALDALGDAFLRGVVEAQQIGPVVQLLMQSER